MNGLFPTMNIFLLIPEYFLCRSFMCNESVMKGVNSVIFNMILFHTPIV